MRTRPPSLLPRWVYAPAAIGLAVVVLPLLGLLPKVRWSTFIADITEPATASALMLSVRSAAVAVLLCIILGVPLALAISRAPSRIGTVLRTVVTLPLVLPPLVGGVALLSILGRTGIIGPWLDGLGVTIPFTPAAVVVAQTFVAMPFLVISVESSLRSVGRRYEYVAAGLGAGRSRILLRVTLPLIMPGLLAGIVLAFARSVGEFGATALLAGNNPGVTQTIPMAIYTAFNGVGASRQAAMALSVLLIATALIVLLLFPASRGRPGVLTPAREPSPTGAREEIGGESAGLPDLPDAPARGQEITVNCGLRRAAFALEADFNVEAGEVAAIVGPNAAGKSTLLNLIAGHLVPSTGTIRFGGEEYSRPGRVRPPRERNVGVLDQQPMLFPHLSVLENVAFGPRSRGMPKLQAHSRARRLLADVGAGGTEHSRPAALSGGQQQRVALARALATEPEVLVLDEPLAAMDVSVAPSIRALLAHEIARSGVTALVVTHDLMDVVGLASRVLVLEEGRIVEDASVPEFLRAPESSFGAAMAGVNVLAGQGGRLLYLREEELYLSIEPGGAGEQWRGRVEVVEAAGPAPRIRVAVGERTVTVMGDYAQAKKLMAGTEVWVGPVPAATEVSE